MQLLSCQSNANKIACTTTADGSDSIYNVGCLNIPQTATVVILGIGSSIRFKQICYPGHQKQGSYEAMFNIQQTSLFIVFLSMHV